MTGSSEKPASGRAGRGASMRGTVVAVVVATACATGACLVDRLHSTNSLSNGDAAVSFDARFSANLTPAALQDVRPVREQPLPVRPELRTAKNSLAQKLLSDSWRSALFGDPTLLAAALPPPSSPLPESTSPSATTAIPMPRARPVQASLETPALAVESRDTTGAVQPEGRSFLQKLSDLMPGGVKLASLEVDGGMIGSESASPSSLGFGHQTAVYDLTAHAVYMPDGTRLEAHSGLGRLMDDPQHVDVKDLGATPPNVYDLHAREKIFHGVQAVRMIPVGGQNLGRSGLLVHPYMLGPNGDSNGCVSIRNYEKFLAAFQSGAVKRLVVIRSQKDDLSAMQALASQS